MKKPIFIIIFFFAFKILAAQDAGEYHFKFYIQDKSELQNLSNIISVDYLKDNEVRAYANQKEFDQFKTLGYKWEIIEKDLTKSLTMATTLDQMANWDKYPTYEVYRKMLKNFESNYPAICKLDSIGNTVQGRKLYVLKISDNVTSDEAEPEFFYTSTIHGDETTGFILMLRLADSLLRSYGNESEITNLVNNIEIYINPNANPDGTYYGGNNTVSSSRRYNANGVDLNRDFPDPRVGANSPYQIETQAMMDFAESRHFVMSANFHGGVEVMNYPWDAWEEGYSDYKPHPDSEWFKMICTNYVQTARLVNPSYMTSLYSSGVTNGGDWYVVAGGRQDYMNFWHQCKEITMEISNTKLLAVESLNTYWNINKQSLLNYLAECQYGIRGTVKNIDGDPLNAMVFIEGHDVAADSSMVFTGSEFGDYYRLIEQGTYNVIASANGYITDTIKNVNVLNQSATTLNIVLQREGISSEALPNFIKDTLDQNVSKDYEIVIFNTGTETLDYTISLDFPTKSGNWTSLNKNSGTIDINLSDTVILNINTAEIYSGDYVCLISITENDGTHYDIPVNIHVNYLSYAHPDYILDTISVGDSNSHKIIIENKSSTTLNYSLEIDYSTKSGSWISVDKDLGIIEPQSTDTVIANINTINLTPGHYECSIRITENEQSNYLIPVNLVVNQTQGIGDIKSNTINLRVYPNPFTDHITVEFISNSDETYLSVYDIVGNLKYHKQILCNPNAKTIVNLENYFNLEKLNYGIYFIQVSSPGNKHSIKLLKQ